MACLKLALQSCCNHLTFRSGAPLLNIMPARTNIAKHEKLRIYEKQQAILKHPVPINWVRPEKAAYDDPKRTGDRVHHIKLDMTKHPLMYEEAEEFETANELVKRFYSFDFLGHRHATKRLLADTVNHVKMHKYDNFSSEAKIAAMTVNIRGLRELVPTLTGSKRTKVYLKELIDKRRRRMKILRKRDYKRFEWLLEKLDLEFRPAPDYTDRVERKKSIRKLTAKYCEEYRANKLKEYSEYLNSQKTDFLKEKYEALKWVRAEEIDCGVEPTVSEKDIAEAAKRLQEQLSSLPATQLKNERKSIEL